MLSDSFLHHLSKKLSEVVDSDVSIHQHNTVSGGSINSAYKLGTSAGNFFLKHNHAETHPRMFETEAAGLELLRATNTLKVPEPRVTGQFEDQTWLIMEHLEASQPQEIYWEDFGSSLAELHRTTADQFGLDHDNYMGSVPQPNTQSANWAEFYSTQRIEPLVKKCMDEGLCDSSVARPIARLCNKLDTLIPREAPALIHGDLWSGNFLCTKDGKSAIFDPASHYGHREADIAMTMLFGGFQPQFYNSYEAAYPLQPEFSDRVGIHQLYPLLIHVLLFGESYLGRVREVLREYS